MWGLAKLLFCILRQDLARETAGGLPSIHSQPSRASGSSLCSRRAGFRFKGIGTSIHFWDNAGANSPLGIVGGDLEPCPWDCQISGANGDVGINDFLDLLGQWSAVGVSCDLGEGPPGVGVEDFLALLGHWGPCP